MLSLRKYKSEAHLQSICTKWYNANYLNEYHRLYLIFNNPPNARMAGILKSMGLNRGIADQVYFPPNEVDTVWIDYKLPGETQSKDQERFQEMVEARGDVYVLIDDEEQFYNLIKSYN